jgi:hypothetical protein
MNLQIMMNIILLLESFNSFTSLISLFNIFLPSLVLPLEVGLVESLEVVFPRVMEVLAAAPPLLSIFNCPNVLGNRVARRRRRLRGGPFLLGTLLLVE